MKLGEWLAAQLRRNNWEIVRTTRIPEDWAERNLVLIELTNTELEAMILNDN